MGLLRSSGVLFAMALSVLASELTQPGQVHLSVDESMNVVVTWSTKVSCPSVVEYGVSDLNLVANGSSTLFVDGGPLHLMQHMHRVVLTALTAGRRYAYRAGSDLGWSWQYSFVALRSDASWSPRIGLVGDMGLENAHALPLLVDEVSAGHLDLLLHVGDFAYNMDTDNGLVGDRFMDMLQPLAAQLPYMTCVGNHEQAYNFSHYKARFSMPGEMFYSVDVGPAHIVSLTTEFYYYTQYGLDQIRRQYEWLQQDLARANERRAERPWLIVLGHRPMYCSNSDDPEHCTNPENMVRVGIPFLHLYGLERLLYEQGVDLAFWAHEHSYERTWPVYQNRLVPGDQPYVRPQAPVHVVTGSGGCVEGQDPFENSTHTWSAFRSDDFGYTRLILHNGSHLQLQQVSSNQAGKVIDEAWLLQDSHGPFPHAPRVQ